MLKVGVLGAGHLGKIHIKCWKNISNIELVGFYDSDPENVSAIFVNKAIKEAHKLGKKVVLISAQLPYDAAYYTDADATLLAYNPSGMTELPSEGKRPIVKYGANVPAAVYVALGGAKPQGTCPVKLDVF